MYWTERKFENLTILYNCIIATNCILVIIINKLSMHLELFYQLYSSNAVVIRIVKA